MQVCASFMIATINLKWFWDHKYELAEILTSEMQILCQFCDRSYKSAAFFVIVTGNLQQFCNQMLIYSSLGITDMNLQQFWDHSHELTAVLGSKCKFVTLQ